MDSCCERGTESSGPYSIQQVKYNDKQSLLQKPEIVVVRRRTNFKVIMMCKLLLPKVASQMFVH